MRKPIAPKLQQFATIERYQVAYSNYTAALVLYTHWKKCNRINKGLKPN